jgi:hypothetical protein
VVNPDSVFSICDGMRLISQPVQERHHGKSQNSPPTFDSLSPHHAYTGNTGAWGHV